MAERQRAWNLYEAVILLEGLLEVREKGARVKDIVKRVSRDLRDIARYNKESIDDIFRNENGVFFQMQSMDSAYQGYTVVKPATRLFTDTVSMYKLNKPEYDRILKDAKSMIDIVRLSRYNALKKQLQEALQKESSRNKYGTTLVFLMNVTGCMDEEMLTQILSKAEWAKYQYGRYFYVDDDQDDGLSETTASAAKEKNETSIEETSSDRDDVGGYSDSDDANRPIARLPEDIVLMNRYPDLYKQIYEALANLYFAGKRYITLEKLQSIVSSSAETKDFEEILDKASWAVKIGSRYSFSSVAVNSQKKRVAVVEKQVQSHNEEKNKFGVSREEFWQYLFSVQKLSQTTARKYSAAIWDCEMFAKSKNYRSWRLYDTGLEEARKTVERLFNDDIFNAYNIQRHNILKTAINLFYTFICGDVSMLKDVDAEDTVLPRTYSHIERDITKSAKQNVAENRDETKESHTDKPEQNDHNETYESILKEKFRKGFRLGSAIDIRRFKSFYADKYGAEPQENDGVIRQTIERVCVLCDDRAYLPELILGEDLKIRLLQYIDDCFDSGKAVIYFQAICAEFRDEFLDCPLYDNPDMLKAYLRTVCHGKYYFNRSSISKERNAVADPVAEVRDCLRRFDRPMTVKEICGKLPHLPEKKIKYILTSMDEFIWNAKETYFHESAMHITDEELEDVAGLIGLMLDDRDYIGGNELYDSVKEKYPGILDANTALSMVGFREALGYKLRGQFSFNGNIISRSGQNWSMMDVFSDYGRNHPEFTLDALKDFAAKLDTTIYYDSLYTNCLRVSRERFVSDKYVQFNVEETDAAVDYLCGGDYISIKDVVDFGGFPDAGFPWNNFLLEQYIFGYSKKYRLLHAGFNNEKCTGAIVKRSANISSFDDFLVRLLVDEGVDLRESVVLDFLVEKGYLARRKYAKIGQIITRAKAQ